MILSRILNKRQVFINYSFTVFGITATLFVFCPCMFEISIAHSIKFKFLLFISMDEKWSSNIAKSVAKLLTVNLINLFWFIWAVISIFTFMIFFIDKVINAIGGDGLKIFVHFGQYFQDLFAQDELFVHSLLLEMFLGGLLGLGWIVVKTTFFFLDKIQQILHSK